MTTNNTPQLNPAQQEAVTYSDGPLLILAGAGTGKTTVITEKIAYLVTEKQVPLESILALTFTDKAAEEMETRVSARVQTGYRELHTSTFHSFCQRILEDFALDIGLSPGSRLLAQTDAWLLVREHLATFDLDYYRPLGSPTKHIHALLSHFSLLKDHLITPEMYLAFAQEYAKRPTEEVSEEEAQRVQELAQAYARYQQLLLDEAAYDFGDLLLYTVKLMRERPAIRAKIQKQFPYVLVDEFQDVNHAQYELTKLLASEAGQLTVVGDDDQSIYAFRGSSVEHIMRFSDDFPDCKTVVLTENYRSTQEILDTAYTSIQHNNPYRLEEKLGLNKQLHGQRTQPNSVTHLHGKTLDDEVQLVIEELLHIKENDADATWDDMAILVRAHNHAEPFMQRMEKIGIPYESLAAQGLYRQPLILDCLSFFALLEHYREGKAVYRLLKSPVVALRESDIHTLIAHAKKKLISYYDAIKAASYLGISEDGQEKLTTFLGWLHQGLQRATSEKPSTILYQFLEESGYLTYLMKEEEQGNRDVIRQIRHIRQFFDHIDAFETAHPEADVRMFLEEFAYILDSGDEGTLPPVVDTPDSVNIMTVHASKGLEYKYVFVVNLVEGRFPGRRRGGGIELPDGLVAHGMDRNPNDAHYDEERRLFYVAATRAKERLYLLSSLDYGGARKKKISRFLHELSFEEEGTTTPQKSDTFEQTPQSALPSDQDEHIYPLPKAFSFSQIRAYESCPYQYKLAHILKIPTRGAASFSFGSTMHNTLHAFYKRVQEMNSATQSSLFDLAPAPTPDDGVQVPTIEALLEMYEKSWIDDWYESAEQKASYRKKGEQILRQLYAAEDGNWTIPVSLEGWFKIQIGDYLLHGRIDRIDQLPDGTLEIIDYKTGKTKEKLSKEDKEQLLIYQIATQMLPEYRHLGDTSKLTFHYVNDDVKTSFIGSPKEIEAIKEKVMSVAAGIHSRNFDPTPDQFTCTYCDFRDICDYRAN